MALQLFYLEHWIFLKAPLRAPLFKERKGEGLMIPRLWRSIFSFCILPPRSTCFFLLFYILILLVTSTPCSRRSDIYCTLSLKRGDSEQRLWAPKPLWQHLDLVIVWGVLFANFSFVIYYNGLSFFFLITISSCFHLVLFSFFYNLQALISLGLGDHIYRAFKEWILLKGSVILFCMEQRRRILGRS